MWLLDANMPVQLVALLKELGIEADSSGARGWNTLSNGSLVTEAVRRNFSALLTRDRLFAETASQSLKVHKDFCIVRVRLPQVRANQFLAAFPRPGRPRKSFRRRVG